MHIHQDHLDTTLTQYHTYLNLAYLAHIYSKLQLSYFTKICFISIIEFVLAISCGVDILHTTCPYSILTNKPF
jgi:hypothetical protein